MNTKKFVAAMLVLSMAFGFAGCSGAKKYSDALKKVGFTKMDYKDAKKIDEDDDEMEDGVYTVITDEKDLKKILKNYDYDKDEVKSFATGYKAMEKKDDYAYMTVIVVEFTDKEAAEDAFDDLYDSVKDTYKYNKDNDADFNDDGDYAIMNLEYELYDVDRYEIEAVYLEGKTVIYVDAYGRGKPGSEIADTVNEYCDKAGLLQPSEI